MEIPQLPDKEGAKLLKRLKKYANIYDSKRKHPSTVNVDKAFPKSNGKIDPVTDFASSHGHTVMASTKHQLLHNGDEPGFNTRMVRESFLKVTVSLLKNYKKWMHTDTSSTLPGYEATVSFKRKEFLEENSSSREFLSFLCGTQCFQMFLQAMFKKDKTPYNEFFDQYVECAYYYF